MLQIKNAQGQLSNFTEEEKRQFTFDLGAMRSANGRVPDDNGDVVVVCGTLIFVPPSGDTSGDTDTAAIKAAIAQAANTSKGIGFIEGDYYWNDTVDITDGYRTQFESVRTGLNPLPASVIIPPKLVGAGLYRTRHRMVVSGKPMLRYYGTANGVQMQSPFIFGMNFHGPGFNTGNFMTSAIQFGGVSTTYKNITADPQLTQVGFFDFNTCVRHDDTTGATYDKCFFQRFLFGVDRGYNCDIFKFHSCDFGDQSLNSNFTCTITNNSTTITTTGNQFNDVPSGAYVAGNGIPNGTTITVNSGNSATLSNPATLTGTTKLYAFLGVAVVDSGTGYGTGWVPPFGENGSGNILVFDSCWFLRIKMVLGAYAPSSSAIRFTNSYTELLWKMAELGLPGDATCPSMFTVENHHFSQTESFMVNGVVDVRSSGSTNGVVMKWTDNRSDSLSPNASQVPWVFAPNAYNSTAAFLWDRNILATNDGIPTVNVAGSSATIPDKTRYVVGTNKGVQSGGFVRNYNASAGTLIWDYGGEDQVHVDLNANVTINDHGSQNPPKGRELTFLVTDSGAGGKVITFGSKYLNSSGAAIGAFTTSVAGKTAVFKFIWDGNNYRQLNTTQWA
jgi:hypothetical protein